VFYVATVLAPLVLLLDLHVDFLRDWPVHLWIIDYHRQYFREHGDLPTVVNTLQSIGMPQPVFYGCQLYPLLGVVSAVLGTPLALRLALATMLAIQFGAALGAGRRLLGHRGLAYTLAVAAIWSTYSLTNLYNRGALAEYFATGFYMTSLALGASAIAAQPGENRRYFGWLSGFFLLLAIGSHPPTAVLAGIFFVALGVVLALGARRSGWQWTSGDRGLIVVALVLGVSVLGAWIYANLKLGPGMAITRSAEGFQFLPEHSDTFWGRFGPLPYDARSMEDGIATQGAPYLETQISIVLLGLLVWNLALCRRISRLGGVAADAARPQTARYILGLAIAWFLFLAVFSISPWLAGHFRFLAPYIQFVYRLVTHCNAALFVGVLASGAMVARQGGYLRFQRQTELVVAAALTAAVLGLVLKLQHAAATEAWEEGRKISLIGGQTDIARNYMVPGLVRELTPAEEKEALSGNFPVGPPGAAFGDVSPVELNLSRAIWLQTNALVHPWVKLERDGKIVAVGELAQIGQFLAVPLSAGRHQLRVRWEPDPVWLVLFRISQAAFAVTLAITAVWTVRHWRQLLTRPNERAADHEP